MKKGLAISVREKNGNAHVEASIVSGRLKTGFRVNSLIDHTFSEKDLDPEKLLEHMNLVILEAISPIHHNQREIPVVVGVPPGIISKILPEGICRAFQTGFGSVRDYHLAEAWTIGLQKAINPKKIRIHPGDWEDEYDEILAKGKSELSLTPEIKSRISQIRDNVATISRKSSLRFLQERAYADGKEYANKDIASGQAGIRFRLLHDPRLSMDDSLIYTYLNEHPSLKKEFVRGLASVFGWSGGPFGGKKLPMIPPHYTCIKTREDPKASQFSNVAMTYLADQCSLEGEGIPYGHIQETI